MVHEIAIQHFGTIRNATVRLTRLHAFVGPNGAGKSTFLQAIDATLYVGQHREFGLGGLLDDTLACVGMLPARLFAETDRGSIGATLRRDGPGYLTITDRIQEDPSFSMNFHRLDAADFKNPYRDLAYVTSPGGVARVEHPENGFYPGAIAGLMARLRAMAEHAQVLMTTHSPLVLNEMQPDEVTLVRRDPKTDETVFLPIAKTANLADRLKVYALGELWVSYLDGLWSEV